MNLFRIISFVFQPKHASIKLHNHSEQWSTQGRPLCTHFLRNNKMSISEIKNFDHHRHQSSKASEINTVSWRTTLTTAFTVRRASKTNVSLPHSKNFCVRPWLRSRQKSQVFTLLCNHRVLVAKKTAKIFNVTVHLQITN